MDVILSELYYRPRSVELCLCAAKLAFKEGRKDESLEIYVFVLSFCAAAPVRRLCYDNLLFLSTRTGIANRIFAASFVFGQRFPLTMTTCRRLDLFERTVASFFARADTCCISHIYVVDDGSTAEHLKAMTRILKHTEVPFELTVKNPAEKGHGRSMNQIRAWVLAQGAPFFVHLEDDFEFFVDFPFVRFATEVLFEFPCYSQYLFSNSYREHASDFKEEPLGRRRVTEGGSVFYEHIWRDSKNPHGYWPGFSLRPGLIRTSALEQVGEFIHSGCFEKDYCTRVAAAGWKTAYGETTMCEHIGRKTSERSDPSKQNAYDLNRTIQFENFWHRKVRLEPLDVATASSPILDRLFLRDHTEMPPAEVALAAAHVRAWIELVADFKDVQVSLVQLRAPDVRAGDFLNALAGSFDAWDIVFLPAEPSTALRALAPPEVATALELAGAYVLNFTGAHKLLAHIEHEGLASVARAIVDAKLIALTTN